MKGTVSFVGAVCVLACLLAGCGSLGVILPPPFQGETRFSGVVANLPTEHHEDGSRSAKLSFKPEALHYQEDHDYCWAACTQTVLAIHGSLPVPSQEELWRDNVGNPLFQEDRKTATYHEIRYALSGSYRDRMFGFVVIDAADSPDVAHLIRQLTVGEATIIGLRETREEDVGHAYVAYGMRYRAAEDSSVSAAQAVTVINEGWKKAKGVPGVGKPSGKAGVPDNRYEAVGFYLFDPDPGVGGLVYKSVSELSQSLDFVVSRASANEYLAEQWSWLQKHANGPGVYVRNPLDRGGKPVAWTSLPLNE